MIHVIWEFRVIAGRQGEFERRYASDGTWAALFRRSPAYVRTVLLRDTLDPHRYVTTDIWTDADGMQAFMSQHEPEYRQLDESCRSLTESERLIGRYDVV